MAQRSFSGNESWVFRAAQVDELCGHHAGLIGQAIGARERIHDLVYSPRRDAAGGPFGLQPKSGSHALAVTDARLIITRDPHQPGHSPTAHAVPLDAVLAVEIGEALTLGWLVVRHQDDGRAGSEVIIFPSSGIHHFRRAVRSWRRGVWPDGAGSAGDDSWQPLQASVPAYLLSQVVPVVVEGERLVAGVTGNEAWCPPQGGRPVCSAAPAFVAVTDRGVLCAQSEPPYEPGALVFGVNVTCLDRRAIRHAAVIPEGDERSPFTRLVLTVEAGSVGFDMDLALGGRSRREVNEAIAPLELPCRDGS